MSHVTVTPPQNHLFSDTRALEAAASRAGQVPGLPGQLLPAAPALDAGQGQALCGGAAGSRERPEGERKMPGTHGHSNSACVPDFPAPASLGGQGHGGDTVDPGGAAEGLKAKRQEVGRAAGRASLGQRRGLAPEGREGMQRSASRGGTKGAPVGPGAGTERGWGGAAAQGHTGSAPSPACLATSLLLPQEPGTRPESPGLGYCSVMGRGSDSPQL